MKRITLILIAVLLLNSCKKDDPQPNSSSPGVTYVHEYIKPFQPYRFYDDIGDWNNPNTSQNNAIITFDSDTSILLSYPQLFQDTLYSFGRYYVEEDTMYMQTLQELEDPYGDDYVAKYVIEDIDSLDCAYSLYIICTYLGNGDISILSDEWQNDPEAYLYCPTLTDTYYYFVAIE